MRTDWYEAASLVLLPGRLLEAFSNGGPRRMIIVRRSFTGGGYRTRLTDPL